MRAKRQLPMRHSDSYDDHRNGFSWTLRWKHSVARAILSVRLCHRNRTCSI